MLVSRGLNNSLPVPRCPRERRHYTRTTPSISRFTFAFALSTLPLVSDELPLKPPPDDPPASRPPTPAPAFIALLAPWVGLLSLILAAILPFLPGSRDPVAELTHAQPWSPADRFIAVIIYVPPLAIFLGIVVLWQMRKEPRPLSDAHFAQRMQAKVGIGLALIASFIIYLYVALRGPPAAP